MAALPNGARLGPYEILAPLGAGGMGDVYRARDTRLGRTVAIKLLHPELSGDAISRERFEREARSIAALTHPHICTMHDVGDHEGNAFLVMELLEGQTLAARLARTKGGLPLDEALSIATHVAEALAFAHRHHITHRDIKPANIMLTPTGVKLLDFGLAQLRDRDEVTGQSRTHTSLTGPLGVMGTLAYMSPEQLDGRADERSDIFSFGAVLFEMLTGRKAFDGATSSAVIGAVVQTDSPAVSSLRPDVSPALDRVVRRCLAKDPDARWQSTVDLVDELRWISGHPIPAGDTVGFPARPRRQRAVAALAMTSAAATLAVLGMWLGLRVADGRRVLTPAAVFVVSVPDGYELAASTKAALSPDGRMVVFGASDAKGVTGLWLRTLDEERPRALPGTEDAAYAFWSPDSTAVAFFANKQLKRVAIAGGPAFTVCEAESGRGGAWNAAGDILFAPSPSSPLMKVPASGGAPIPITVLDDADNSHRAPFFLPDGDHFLYFSLGKSAPDSALRVDSLSRPGPRTLLSDPTSAEYAGGLLYFVRRGTLMAQPFDLQTLALTGETRAVSEDVVRFNTGLHGYSVSSTGATSFLRQFTTPAQVRLTWMTRDGRAVGTVGPAGDLSQPSLSPDAHSIAVVRRDDDRRRNVWTIDVAQGSATRLPHATFDSWGPVWTPDGKRLAVTSHDRVDAPFVLSSIAADGSGPPQVLITDQFARWATGWSADQSWFFFESVDQRGTVSLWRRLVNGGEPQAIRQDGFINRRARSSPDGRWIAYASNQTGRFEVYVESVLTPGRRWPVSTAGGDQARWSHDQRELYYLSPEGWLTTAPLRFGPGLTIGAAKRLFAIRTPQAENNPDSLFILGAAHQYDVAADGRFLIAVVERAAVTRRDILVTLGGPR